MITHDWLVDQYSSKWWFNHQPVNCWSSPSVSCQDFAGAAETFKRMDLHFQNLPVSQQWIFIEHPVYAFIWSDLHFLKQMDIHVQVNAENTPVYTSILCARMRASPKCQHGEVVEATAALFCRLGEPHAAEPADSRVRLTTVMSEYNMYNLPIPFLWKTRGKIAST